VTRVVEAICLSRPSAAGKTSTRVRIAIPVRAYKRSALLQSTETAGLLLTAPTQVHVAAPGVLIIGLRRLGQRGQQKSKRHCSGGEDGSMDHYLTLGLVGLRMYGKCSAQGGVPQKRLASLVTDTKILRRPVFLLALGDYLQRIDGSGSFAAPLHSLAHCSLQIRVAPASGALQVWTATVAGRAGTAILS
jgi:hypothetical protein